jgi:hypothetical protein
VRLAGHLHAAAIGVTALSAAAMAASPPIDVDTLLSSVAARVETYYARAQSLVCTETVRLQPLDSDWTPRDHARTLVYDLRVEWDRGRDGDTPADPTIVRQIRTVDGRPPRPKDEPGCMDPKPVSPDSLAMLLPAHRSEYLFAFAGQGRTDKRAALMLDYKAHAPGRPDVIWKGDCVSVELPGRFRGRVWVDPETRDVLRVDERLVGLFEFNVPDKHWRPGGPSSMVIERADSSTRYRQVAFHDPDEALTLPASIDTFQIVRHAGVPRLRVTQTFSDYRRFLTGGRMVKPGGEK